MGCDYFYGVQVEMPIDGLMSFADATEMRGLSESTLRNAVSYGKLVNGAEVCKFERASLPLRIQTCFFDKLTRK